ncbi:MAG: hypothetical protein ACFFA0_07525 [Promethearchaeota archaeon]
MNELINTFQAHSNCALGLGFIPEGSTLLSTGIDNVINYGIEFS